MKSNTRSEPVRANESGSPQATVLITDYAWPSVDIERGILEKVGAKLVIASIGSEDELIELAGDVDGILCNWKKVTSRVLHAASRCIGVGRYGIGLDNIDVGVATSLGIIVTNVPAYCVDEVADHTMALLLSCLRKVVFFDRDMKVGTYDVQAHTPVYRLHGRTLGIAGFGKIGRAVALRARHFGFHVLAYSSTLRREHSASVEFVSFPELLSRSDCISIHLPSTSQTRGIFGQESFAQMKPGIVIINTARGDLIDNGALLRALDSGKVNAAGLDVWRTEPPASDDTLPRHPRVLATPHAAFNSLEAILELEQTAAKQMAQLLTGLQPDNIINPSALKSPNLRAAIYRK